jgi:opacity protein-like surface antigen
MFQTTLISRYPITKHNSWMIARNSTLAVVLALGFALDAEAEDIKTDESIQVSCNPFTSNDSTAQCHSNLNFEPQVEQVAQSRRGRRRKSKVDGYYGGFSLGVGFPNGKVAVDNGTNTEFPQPEYGNGFIGSFFGGVRVNKNISADLEFLLGIGGADTEELDDFTNDPDNNINLNGTFESEGDYSAFAFYLNPRFELPLNESRSFSLYASPGIGISQTNVNFTTNDDGEGELSDVDESSTGFTYQIKGGASFSFTDTVGVFGQLRYASLPTGEFVDTINIFSIETGMKFNF